ncbi:hypothetical protein AV654_24520 [Paenibacillus elgii]|uniref:Uncharacterized protein n=1 Tax=Paenibacillus elgii TaxID=189691 RepID=A0A165QQY9_9BACL|nr:hypothetical protein AV654_24520 [Paenibacillus elgii]
MILSSIPIVVFFCHFPALDHSRDYGWRRKRVTDYEFGGTSEAYYFMGNRDIRWISSTKDACWTEKPVSGQA